MYFPSWNEQVIWSFPTKYICSKYYVKTDCFLIRLQFSLTATTNNTVKTIFYHSIYTSVFALMKIVMIIMRAQNVKWERTTITDVWIGKQLEGECKNIKEVRVLFLSVYKGIYEKLERIILIFFLKKKYPTSYSNRDNNAFCTTLFFGNTIIIVRLIDKRSFLNILPFMGKVSVKAE